MKYTRNEEALEPLINAIESRRQADLSAFQKARYWYLLPVSLLLIGLPASLFYDLSLILCFGFCICFAIFIEYRKVMPSKEAYSEHYKKVFVKPFVSIFYPNVAYLPGQFSTSNDIQASFLYDLLGKEGGLICEDGFRGKTKEGLDFTMMEVQYGVDGHGRMETKRELFVSIVLSKKGYRPVVVAPNSIMEYVLERYNKENTDQESIVKQSSFNAYFDTNYVVYSQEEQDAEAVLTAPFIRLIEGLEKQWAGAVRFSFVNDVLHIAIPSLYDFFEGKIEKKVLSSTVGQELFEELSTCLSVVADLSACLSGLALPSQERILLPKEDAKLPNWDNSAYDHFMDNEM